MCLPSHPSPLPLQLEEMSTKDDNEHSWLSWKEQQLELCVIRAPTPASIQSDMWQINDERVTLLVE